MKTAMIALVGAQPLPNLIPVRYYRPDAVVLVYTITNPIIQRVYNHLLKTLEKDCLVVGIEVDPSNIITATAAIDTGLNQFQLVDHELIFNLTGGTKAMALAGYQITQQRRAPFLYLESEKRKSVVYFYEWLDDRLQMKEPELIPACIGLPDFLNVHLGPGSWKEQGAARQEGGPFEDALAAALRPHVDEVMVGVKTMNGQIDLDLVIRLDNQFGIIEAKAGVNGGKLDGIKQLSNAVRHLGTFTQQFYAITVAPNETHQAVVDASRIQVISLPEHIDKQGLTPNSVSVLVDKVRTAMA